MYKLNSDTWTEMSETKGTFWNKSSKNDLLLANSLNTPENDDDTILLKAGEKKYFEIFTGKIFAKAIRGEAKLAVSGFSSSSGMLSAKIAENKEQIENLLSFAHPTAVANVYNIDFKNAVVKNAAIETEDTNAKSFSLSNIPTRCELLIELTYTNECAITWFSGISWLSGVAPTFYEGKLYKIAFETSDGGVNWRASVGGSW